jgi:hypothetical protein
MLKELYMRDPSDPLYTTNTLEQSSEIETLLGEIRMILFTKQGDVLGAYTFGYNLEDNLFLFNLNEADLRNKLLETILYYCPDASSHAVDVSVQFFKGTVRDICLIDIYIDSQKLLGVVVR